MSNKRESTFGEASSFNREWTQMCNAFTEPVKHGMYSEHGANRKASHKMEPRKAADGLSGDDDTPSEGVTHQDLGLRLEKTPWIMQVPPPASESLQQQSPASCLY